MAGIKIESGANTPGSPNVDSSFNLQVVIPPISTAINITTSTGTQVMALNGCAGLGVQILSIGTGGVVVFEGSSDNTNWSTMNGVVNPTGGVVTGASAAGAWQFDSVGVTYFRIRATALTSGSITGYIVATANGSIFSMEQGTLSAATAGSEQALVVRAIPQSSTLCQSATAAANTGLTVTLPAAGAGLFHYITGIEITRNATAALAGTATLVITTTNLSGSRAWSVGNAMAAGGTQIDVSIMRTIPIKSSVANTATTIVMPVPGAAVLWRCNVDYYVGT
jgi:hypothetical protein